MCSQYQGSDEHPERHQREQPTTFVIRQKPGCHDREGARDRRGSYWFNPSITRRDRCRSKDVVSSTNLTTCQIRAQRLGNGGSRSRYREVCHDHYRRRRNHMARSRHYSIVGRVRRHPVPIAIALRAPRLRRRRCRVARRRARLREPAVVLAASQELGARRAQSSRRRRQDEVRGLRPVVPQPRVSRPGRSALMGGRVAGRQYRDTYVLPPAWEHAIVGWLGWLTTGGAAKSTLRARRSHARMIARRSGTQHPRDITLAVLASRCSGQDWSPDRCKGVRTSLVSFYDWALDNEVVQDNPAMRLPKVRAGGPRPRPATDDVWHSIQAKATPRELMMIRLAGEAGMRGAEVDVCHRDDLIEDQRGGSLIVHGKGGKQRFVPVSESLWRPRSATRTPAALATCARRLTGGTTCWRRTSRRTASGS